MVKLFLLLGLALSPLAAAAVAGPSLSSRNIPGLSQSDLLQERQDNTIETRDIKDDAAFNGAIMHKREPGHERALPRYQFVSLENAPPSGLFEKRAGGGGEGGGGASGGESGSSSSGSGDDGDDGEGSGSGSSSSGSSGSASSGSSGNDSGASDLMVSRSALAVAVVGVAVLTAM
ncbi:MAG: hypothetical protein M1821_000468 [Bathelium mastoideum]|nr:MAG: hypothetical protein M1821_000468 [Bathelium mastoideum]